MEIAFRTKALRETCQSEERMERQFGSVVAKALKARIADIRAAEAIRDVLPGRPSVVSGKGGELISIDLADGAVALVKANHSRNPRLVDGKVDWSLVSQVMLQRIEGIDG